MINDESSKTKFILSKKAFSPYHFGLTCRSLVSIKYLESKPNLNRKSKLLPEIITENSLKEIPSYLHNFTNVSGAKNRRKIKILKTVRTLIGSKNNNSKKLEREYYETLERKISNNKTIKIINDATKGNWLENSKLKELIPKIYLNCKKEEFSTQKMNCEPIKDCNDSEASIQVSKMTTFP